MHEKIKTKIKKKKSPEEILKEKRQFETLMRGRFHPNGEVHFLSKFKINILHFIFSILLVF